jgi:hypothetical protein
VLRRGLLRQYHHLGRQNGVNPAESCRRYCNVSIYTEHWHRHHGPTATSGFHTGAATMRNEHVLSRYAACVPHKRFSVASHGSLSDAVTYRCCRGQSESADGQELQLGSSCERRAGGQCHDHPPSTCTSSTDCPVMRCSSVTVCYN